MEEMSLQEIYADLGGVPEIADALGVTRWRVKRWIERQESTGCPDPVRRLSAMNVYSIMEWKGWFAIWRVTRGSETWERKTQPSVSGGSRSGFG